MLGYFRFNAHGAQGTTVVRPRGDTAGTVWIARAALFCALAVAPNGAVYGQALFESNAISFSNSVPLGTYAPKPAQDASQSRANAVVFPTFGGTSNQTVRAPAAVPLAFPAPASGQANQIMTFPAPATQAAVALGAAPRPTATTLPATAAFASGPTATLFPAPPLSTARPQAPLTRTGQPAQVPAAALVASAPDNQAVSFPAPGEILGSQGVTSIGNAATAAGQQSTNYQALVDRYGGDAPAATLIPASMSADGARTSDLQNLLTRTIDGDDRVKGLTLRLSARDADAESLRALWQPRLETGYSTDYNVREGVTNSVTLGARQRVFDFGKTDAALETVAAQKILAGARIEDMRFEVATEFLSSYLNALSADRGIQADSREIAVLEQVLTANSRLADAGAASMTAARESQIDLNEARARQTERRLTLEQSLQQLASLTNGVPVQPGPARFEAFVTSLLPGNVDYCINRGVASDPGLAVIDAQIEEARAQVAEISKSRLPSIDIVGQTGIQPFSGSSDLGMREETGINFSINGDLFDGGVNQAEVRAQQLAVRELERQRATARRELELDIRRTFTSVAASRELLSTQRSSLSVLTELMSDRQRQADGGVGLVQDVLRAKVEFEQAQNALATLESDYDRDRTRLILLCGHRF